MNDLIPNVGAGALLERTLLADDRAVRIGAIQTLDYSRAVVITHDKWKEAVGGIPQYAFLLATARESGSGGGDDDEVLLLRVEGTASLSLERDLQAVREESLRDALSRRQDPSPSVILDVNLDPFTRNRVSFTGLDCRIIGTFYEDGRDGTVVLEFGHDVDNFYATATYRVFKPIGEGLSAIASYIKPTDDPVEMVRVGAIRYSSTRRRTMIAKQDDIPVEVNVYDFIGNKTGMFGMTRMGKSNTMKTVAARVFAVSERRRAAALPPVGQLILDPQGEYANPNLQDGTELAAIGPQHVVIYKFGTGGNQANVRPLRFNFFDPQQIEPVKSIISSALADAGSDYVRAFVQADFAGITVAGEPYAETEQRRTRAERGRLILYGALARADFPIPRTHVGPEGQEWPWRAWVPVRKQVADELERQLGQGHIVRPQSGRRIGVERDSLIRVIDWLIERAEARDLAGNAAAGLRSIADGDPWKSALPIFTQVNQGRAVSGYTKLKPLKSFHTPSSRVDYRDEIYRELVRGRSRLALPDQEGRVNRLNQSLLRLLLLVHGQPGRPATTVPVNCPARRCGQRQVPVGRRRDELPRLRGAPVPGRHAPHLRGGDGGRVQPGRPGQADAGDRAAGAGRPNDLALGAVPARCTPVDPVHHGRAARDVRAAGQAARPRRHLLPADDRDHARRRSLPVRRREDRDGRRLRVRAGPARRAPSR